MKKKIVKGNLKTTYTEIKHKNIGTSDLIHPNENLFLDFLLNKYEVDFPG